MIGEVKHKLERLKAELARRDLSGTDQTVNVLERGLRATGLWPRVRVGRELFYELRTPPREFRGLRDLVVRRATRDDRADLCAVNGTSPGLVDARFARGDIVFVGELEGRILAHAWFHSGPAPFVEDEPAYPGWSVPDGTFWSYHAATTSDARSSGVFVKVFQVALRALFLEHGAASIRCRVASTNTTSVLMHERTGFRRLGTLVAVGLPGMRWLSWNGDGGPRRWLHRPRGGLVVVLPPGEA